RSSPGDSPHVAWRNVAFRAYADHMDSDEFRFGLERLLALATARPTAVLCAEAVPWRCHRQLLADALVARGVVVLHATGRGPTSKPGSPATTRWTRCCAASPARPAASTSSGSPTSRGASPRPTST